MSERAEWTCAKGKWEASRQSRRIPPYLPVYKSILVPMNSHQDLEKLIFQEGSQLLKESRKRESLFLKRNWWYQKMLSWVMGNAKLKTSLFRFIDVLPGLSNERQFLSHFQEYFKGQEFAFITSGLGRVAPSLMVKNIKKQISQVARMFITGSDVEEALKVISKNWEKGMAFSMDILGEATVSEREAESYFQRYSSLMDKLLQSSQHWQKKRVASKGFLRAHSFCQYLY